MGKSMQVKQPIIEKVASKAPEKDAGACSKVEKDRHSEELARFLYTVYKNNKEIVDLVLKE